MVNPEQKPLSPISIKEIPIEDITTIFEERHLANQEYLNSKRMRTLEEEVMKTGVIEPIVVEYNFCHFNKGKYSILHGNHRYFIAKKLGYKTMKCVIHLSDKQRNSNLPLGIMTLPIEKILPTLPETHHPEREKNKSLLEDIFKNGIKEKIIVAPTLDCRIKRKYPYMILNGNHRYWIALKLGYKFLEVNAIDIIDV